jgi:hypothetical protein
MQEMRDCYDSLLAAAAATENSAYEFSESLQEMGTCLLKKTALNDDEESVVATVVMNCMQVKFWGCLEMCSLNFRNLLIAT